MNDHALPFSPYKGLIPYSENDANFFFGRQRERDMIEANLIATRLTLLYGASGVGKSSVLRAGVVHHLRHLAAEDLANHGNPEFAVVIVNAWRDDPLTSLLNSVYTALQADLGPLHPAVASLAPPSAAAFVPTLQAWTTALDCDLLLILDQFEEYLFYHATEDGLGTLAMEFPRAVNHPDLRVNFLIAIREDALARLDRFKGRIPRLFENYLRIQHLDVAAARDAIEQPLLTYNRLMAPVQPVTIEPALVDEVLAQVQTNQVFVGESGRGAVSGAGGPARVETPYLQLVMSRLWAEEVQAGESVLRLATLQRLGGAERIVRTHLDTVISTLTPAEQDHAARIFHHLVTPSGTKIAHSVPDLAEYSGLTPAQLEPVLEKLSSSSMRILRPVAPPPDQAAVSRFEIFHDVLAAPILDWRPRFVHAVEQAAAAARLLAERVAAEQRLRQQQAEAAARLAQERRRVRSLRLTALGLLALLLLMVGLAAYARNQYLIATQATVAARDAASRNIAVSANLQMQTDPELSVLLAQSAAQLYPNLQAEDALRQALIASPIRAILSGYERGVVKAIFSPDGRYLAAADYNGLIGIWDAATFRHLAWLTGHAPRIFDLAFSPDSRLLASGGTGAVVRLWDVPSGALHAEIANLGGEVYHVNFSPDGALLAIGSGSHTGYVWDVQAGEMTLFLEGHRNGLISAVFSPDGSVIATTSQDNTARLWETASGRPLVVLAGHDAEIVDVSFSANGQWLATASGDDTARVWKLPAGEFHREFRGHTDRVLVVRLSADGRRLFTASADGRAIVWDVASGQPQAELRHQDRITALELSPDERLLLTSSADRTAALWNTRTWQRLATLRGHTDAINHGRFSASGALVITAGQDNTVRVWTANAGQPLQVLAEMPSTAPGCDGSCNPVWSAIFSPDGSRVVTANANGTVGLWDALSGARLATLAGHEGAVYQAAFSPDGQQILSAGQDGSVRLWPVNPAGEPVIWRGHSGPVNHAVFSADGKRALTTSNDQTALLWDVASGQVMATLRGHSGAVLAGAFSPDGTRAVTAGADGSAIIWNVGRGEAQSTLSGHSALVYDAVFSPDGRLVATASADGTARLWDASSGQPQGAPLAHEGAVTHALFSPDGRFVLTTSQDQTAALWDAASGLRLFRLAGHQAPVTAAAFSPDGRFAITGGDTGDPTVRLWDLRTGQILMTFWGHAAGVRGLSFSADGRHFASAGADGAAQVYDCNVCGSLDDLLALAPSHVTRELTVEERQKYLYELAVRR
ncbi:MAG: WD40 repeat domain-containing protein [Anaerolineae bacterium]